jgi:hypothetical protein
MGAFIARFAAGRNRRLAENPPGKYQLPLSAGGNSMAPDCYGVSTNGLI